MLANVNTRVRLFSFLLIMLLRKFKLPNAISTGGSSLSHRNIKAVQDKVDEVRFISKNIMESCTITNGIKKTRRILMRHSHQFSCPACCVLNSLFFYHYSEKSEWKFRGYNLLV